MQCWICLSAEFEKSFCTFLVEKRVLFFASALVVIFSFFESSSFSSVLICCTLDGFFSKMKVALLFAGVVFC